MSAKDAIRAREEAKHPRPVVIEPPKRAPNPKPVIEPTVEVDELAEPEHAIKDEE